MFIKIREKYGITPMRWKGEEDHIYYLFKINPTTALAKFMNT